MDCEICGHDVDNHRNDGCMVYQCECKRTWRHSDHPSYKQQAARITALEQTERELREAVRVLGNRIRIGSELHEFTRTEYSQRDKDRKAMNRKRTKMKMAFFVACDEVDANPIAAASVREAGK